jgi:hypothetical protein
VTIDFKSLSAADRNALLLQMQAMQADERAERKAARNRQRGYLSTIVKQIVSGSAPGVSNTPTTFASGAVGYQLGGKDLDITLEDGTVRKATVSMLIRWSDTIPEKEKKAEAKAEAEADNA